MQYGTQGRFLIKQKIGCKIVILILHILESLSKLKKRCCYLKSFIRFTYTINCVYIISSRYRDIPKGHHHSDRFPGPNYLNANWFVLFLKRSPDAMDMADTSVAVRKIRL